MVMVVGLACMGQTAAHEQETYNVIVVADGPMPANITDSDFVQGNAVVFRMKDTSENASIRISIDLNGDGSMTTQLTTSLFGLLSHVNSLKMERLLISHAPFHTPMLSI